MKILTLKDLKNSDYLSVDFYLSKSCNKSCHYCTAWTLEMRNLTVDMDFLKRTVEYLSPYKTRICLLGGEPGLIKNLDEVIAEIKLQRVRPRAPIEAPLKEIGPRVLVNRAEAVGPIAPGLQHDPVIATPGDNDILTTTIAKVMLLTPGVNPVRTVITRQHIALITTPKIHIPRKATDVQLRTRTVRIHRKGRVINAADPQRSQRRRI